LSRKTPRNSPPLLSLTRSAQAGRSCSASTMHKQNNEFREADPNMVRFLIIAASGALPEADNP
jgi:hypothetical protein